MGTIEMPAENELTKLIEAYEKAKAENKQLYLDGEQLTDMANWYIGKLEYEKAEEIIEYGLKLHPESIDLLVVKVQHLIDSDRIEEAKATIDTISDSYLPMVKLMKAEIFIREGNITEAEKILEESMEELPDVELLTDVVNLYMQMGNSDKAIDCLNKYENLFKDDPAYMELYADCMINLKKINKAISIFNKLIDKSPYNTYYWLRLAKCHMMQEHYMKAIEACDFALASDNENGEAYLIKGNSYFLLNNAEKTVENMTKALEYKCSILETPYMLMGISYLRMKKPRKALEMLEKAIQILNETNCDEQDTYAEIYDHAINATIDLNDFEKAHRLCEEAQLHVPDSLYLKTMKGYLYLLNEQEKEAHCFFEELIQENPDDLELMKEIAETYENCKCYKEAKYYLKKIFAKDPSYPFVAETLTGISIHERDFESFSIYNQACRRPITPAIATILMKENASDKEIKEGLMDLMSSLTSLYQNNSEKPEKDEGPEGDEDFEETDNK